MGVVFDGSPGIKKILIYWYKSTNTGTHTDADAGGVVFDGFPGKKKNYVLYWYKSKNTDTGTEVQIFCFPNT
jgi:hypothetical protein